MQFREVPSLSRLLDTVLEVEVVPGEVTSKHDLLSVTVSIPTEEFQKLAGHEVENMYLRPMTKALGKKINELGDVMCRAIPIPEKENAWNCTNGRIPVLLRIVRRPDPDRHQILIHAWVQPVGDDDVA
jgi:hypothetical protein